jgi:hypothetical protein
MMTQTAFYLEQAARCRIAAERAALSGQKDEHIEAEKAWRRLAQIPTLFTRFEPEIRSVSPPPTA